MSDNQGTGRLYSELASYSPTAMTVRVLQIVLQVLPGAEPLPHYQTLDDAAGAVFGGYPPDLLERAKQLAIDPRVDQALFAAKSMDTGDTGLTIVSGVRSAVALFFGSKQSRSEAIAQQQRTDAALKALGLAYLITRLVPLQAADRVDLVRSIPAGQALILYYGAIEIAVPFASKVSEAGGTFVRDLVREQGRAMADKLLGMVGRQGVADAEEMLGLLAGELDRAALTAAPHTSAIAEQIRAVLPSYAAGAGDLFDLVAAGADALPCYRYLCARLAVEASLAMAKHEHLPEVALPTATLARKAAAVPEAPPLPPSLMASATGSVSLAALRGAATPPLPETLVSPPAEKLPVSTSATLIADLDDLDPDMFDPDMLDPLDSAAPQAPAKPALQPPLKPAAVFPWPKEPLPESNRLRGFFLSGRPGDVLTGAERWRIFTIEGIYSEAPPSTPSGVDWDALVARGVRVALYRREADVILVTDPASDADTQRLTAVRSPDQTPLTLDGEIFRRMDWDLTKRHIDGRYRSEAGALSFSADGRIEQNEKKGRYTLGVGAVTVAWEGGPTETLSLLSDLKPSSRKPAALWLGDVRWSLA